MAVHVEYMLSDPVGVRQWSHNEFDLSGLRGVLWSAFHTPRLVRLNVDLTYKLVSSLLDELDETMEDARRWRTLVESVNETNERRGSAE